MTYKINFLSQAEKDLAWLRKHDKKNYIKSFDLVRDEAQNPREGIGKPEPMNYPTS